MCQQPVTVVPIILGALGSIPTSLTNSLKLLGTIQKATSIKDAEEHTVEPNPHS